MTVNALWDAGSVESGGIGVSVPLMDIAACCPDGLVAPLEREVAEELAQLLKAVADPARLQLLALIRSAGEACGCDLTAPLGLAQPTVSHHLKVLAKAGLIHRQQRGQWAWFRADEQRIASLGELFHVRDGA
jgi:ArsR family transcriptional regulator